MKNFLLAIGCISLFACHNTKAMSEDPIEQYGRNEKLTDSVLEQLRHNNDVVIAFAFISTAWVRSTDYKILALNNNKWKGYSYSVNNTRRTSTGLQEAGVSSDSCNAVWRFIKENNAAKIQGDNGENFCSGENGKNCNINDGATWQLLLLTKSSVIDPTFYEPEFYENCCPGNTDRQLFLQVVNKIKNAVKTGTET